MTDLLALYSSVEAWTNYTNKPTMLEQAVKKLVSGSLAVYDEKELVTYIRLVGDGHSQLFFVQDLLVQTRSPAPRHWKEALRRGCGTFPNVYQRLLATERSENLTFYQSLGFVELSEQACTGMIYMK